MGTWGTGIFSDDTACDVRGDFREHIGNGLSAEEATQRLMKAYGMDLRRGTVDPEDATFWLGLAATQWQCGRLLDAVKTRTLRVIESGADLELWGEEANPKEIAKRREVLEKLRQQLLSPPPPPKKIKKVYRDRTDWEVGHAVSYRLLLGQLAVFRVIHIDEGRSRIAIVDLCDWIGASPPDGRTIVTLPRRHTRFLQRDLKELDGAMQPPSWQPRTPEQAELLRSLTAISAESGYRERCIQRAIENDGKMAVYSLKPGEFPSDRIQVVAKGLPIKPAENGLQGACYFGGWKGLDTYLADMFGMS